MPATRPVLALLLVGALAAPAWSQTEYDDSSGPGSQGWTVTADPYLDFVRTINGELRGQNAPLFIDAVEFEITRSDRPDDSLERKEALLDQWVSYITDYIELEGFEEMDPERVPEATRVSMEQMREKLRQSIPYGNRNHFGRLGEAMPILIDEYPSDCAGGDGAYAAFIMSMRPAAATRSEYGEVMVMFLGLGDCGPVNPRAKRTLARIKRELTEDFGGGSE